MYVGCNLKQKNCNDKFKQLNKKYMIKNFRQLQLKKLKMFFNKNKKMQKIKIKLNIKIVRFGLKQEFEINTDR